MNTGEVTEPRFEWHEVNGVRLHCAVAGNPDSPAIIALHGYPEFWIAWRDVMAELASAFFVVMPDQRGFNLSSKPAGQDAYLVKNMVADLAALADKVSPGRKFILAGHDWGASIAYGYAFAHGDRLSHLVIANGVHPVCFQRAILFDPEQRQASQYFHRMRAPDAAASMREDGFRRTMNMLAMFSKLDWMTPEIRRDYLAAWGQPGAMEAMTRWYSSSPILVPRIYEVVTDAPLLSIPVEKVSVKVPHLLIWGEADEALRPSCLTDLHHFAPDLAIKRFADSGHWILHERPKEVAAVIKAFVESPAQP